MAIGKFYDEIDPILQSMIDYLGIDEDEEEYFDDLFDDDDDLIDEVVVTMSDVEKCGTILEKYIDDLVSLSKNSSDTAILSAAEKAVKKLNKLNETCECELIESTVSDDICNFIHNAAIEAGLVTDEENICDEWREF